MSDPTPQIVRAILEKLHTLEISSPPVVIVDPLRQAGKPDREPYVQAQILMNQPVTRGVSAGGQYRGLLQLMVCWPSGLDEGIVPAVELAGLVLSEFPLETHMDGDGVRVRVSGKPWMSSPIPSGAWLNVPVTVPYICNTTS